MHLILYRIGKISAQVGEVFLFYLSLVTLYLGGAMTINSCILKISPRCFRWQLAVNTSFAWLRMEMSLLGDGENTATVVPSLTITMTLAVLNCQFPRKQCLLEQVVQHPGLQQSHDDDCFHTS